MLMSEYIGRGGKGGEMTRRMLCIEEGKGYMLTI